MHTEINANIMTPKQIRVLVKEVISEVGLFTLKNPVDATKGLSTVIDPDDNTEKSSAFQQKYKKVTEMARKAKGYQIIDPEFDTTPYATKTVSGISIASIIDYIKENPGVEKKDIQTQFNFVRPQIANALINGLKDAGIIAKMGEIEVDDETGEITVTDEPETQTSRANAEDFFVGNRTSNFFSTGEPSLTADEDEMEAPEELETPELPADRPFVGGLSDEDYNAWMEYSKFKERAARIKSALIQLKKQKRGGDDLSYESNEAERLAIKKAEYEARLKNIIDSNEYVKNKVEQEKNKTSEEDTLNETILRRLKQLANILHD
jgi:hypothetical protein